MTSSDDDVPNVVELDSDVDYNEDIAKNEPIFMSYDEIHNKNNKNSSNNNNNNNQNNTPRRPRTAERIETVEDEDEEYHADTVTAILNPVSITMFLAVIGIWVISNNSPTSEVSQVITIASGSDESGGLSTGTTILVAVIASVAVLVSVLMTTVTFVILYKYRCMKIIFGWLMTSVFTMLSMFGGIFLWYAFDSLQVPFDYITLAVLLWNFGAVGVLSVFWHAPTKLNQAYLILISALIALFFSFATTSIVIAILLIVAIYDIFAVLCPKGPLKVLVETAAERKENIPALVFNASVIMMMADKPTHVGTKRRGIKLGLGDFVFYSVLISLAAQFDLTTVFTCFIAILTGLFMTLLLLAVAQKALPALPISIFLGVLFYFLTVYFLQPYTIAIGAAQVFV